MPPLALGPTITSLSPSPIPRHPSFVLHPLRSPVPVWPGNSQTGLVSVTTAGLLPRAGWGPRGHAGGQKKQVSNRVTAAPADLGAGSLGVGPVVPPGGDSTAEKPGSAEHRPSVEKR